MRVDRDLRVQRKDNPDQTVSPIRDLNRLPLAVIFRPVGYVVRELDVVVARVCRETLDYARPRL